MNIRAYQQFDFSLGVQDATTFLLKQPNELNRGYNLRFTETVGGFERRPGFEEAGDDFSTEGHPALGAIIAKFSNGSARLVAVTNDANDATIIRHQDAGTGAWTTLSNLPAWPADCVMFFKYYLDEVYVSGFDPATGDPIEPVNINKDLDVSTTRNLLHAPWPYFFEEYLGLLYAGNVIANGQRYKDRVYKSSPPLGAMTFMQGAQDNVYASETLVNQIPKMTSNTAPSGVAAASSTLANNPAWGAFERTTNSTANNTRWLTSGPTTPTGWVRYDFGVGNDKVIRYYRIAPANTTINRNPKNWTFEGSPDGTTWTVLDTQTNVPVWVAGEERTYSMSNTTPYRFYRLNITANQGATDYTGVGELKMYAILEANRLIEFKVDSVRYLKAGDVIDVYKAGTETKKFTVTVNTVDKPKNTFTIFPLTNTAGAFNSTNDWLAFTSGQEPSLTDIATGDPVRFTTTGGMPGGLTALTAYYAIRVAGDDTKIRFAATEEQALIGDYIDLTSNGTGVMTLEKMYSVADNDEIWTTGTKGRLNLFWNTDYPNEENSEFLAVKPGTDSSNTVSGLGASSNRLFIFTKNSGSRYDGNNLVVFNHSVGCISHRSIANIDDDWLIWVDAKGNIRARNENQGVQENISRAIRNPLLRKLNQEQLKAVNTGIVDQVAKIYLGEINGQHVRVCYDFEANTWSPERLGYPALMQDTDDFTGDLKPYFFSNNGKLYMDETGTKDSDKNIAFEAGTGKDMLGTHVKKRFYGMLLFTRNCNGLRLQAAVDGGQMQTIGRIEGETCFFKFAEAGDNKLPLGVAFDWQIMDSGEGDAPAVDGAVIYWIPEEDVPSERRQ